MGSLFEYYLELERDQVSSNEPLLPRNRDSRPKPSTRVRRYAKKYFDWLTAGGSKLDERAWSAMKSPSGQKPLQEAEFIKVIRQVCSDFSVDKKKSEIGWNEGQGTIFFLLQFEGTPKAYFLSTDDIDVLLGNWERLVGQSTPKLLSF